MIKRTLAGLLVTLLASPSAVFAQATKPAGVVTVVEGNVTKRRVALPQPEPLKFKDDVFTQDTVTTGDQSLARMLLGGKAVVTVRERSSLTITEIPGRPSTIDLQSGKFALAVAREKMSPGEEIQIRTPNAVAGVRGTVVVTEVERQGAQVGTGVPAVVTNFFVLRGEVTAQQRDAAGNPVGSPFRILTNQSYSGAGFASPRVLPVPAGNLPGILSGLQPTGRKGGGDAGKEQVKAQQTQQAVALAATVSGGQVGTAQNVGQTYPVFTGGVVAPINAFTNKGDQILSSAQQQQLLANFASFDGVFTSTSPDPLFTFLNRSLTTQGSFFSVSPTGIVTLAGPLAKFTGSTGVAGGSLFNIQGGSLKSTSTSALLGLDPTIIEAALNVVAMNGGSLTLAGPLVTDTNGTIIAAGSFLTMSNGATLTDTSTNALVQLTGTKVAAPSALSMTNATMKLAGPLVTAINVTPPDDAVIAAALAALGLSASAGTSVPSFLIDQKSSLTSTGTAPLIQFTLMPFDNKETFLRIDNSSSVNLAGSLLKFTDTKVTAKNVNRSFLVLVNGSSLTTTGTSDPLLQFIGTASGTSSVVAARDFFAASINGTTLSPAMTLSGPFLSATLTSFNTGDPTSNTFSFLFIGDGTQVTSTSTSPFMSFSSSSVDTAGNLLTLRRSTATTPTRLTLAGPLLSATNSTFNTTTLGFGAQFATSPAACCSGLSIDQGAQLSSTTSSALIQLTGSTFTGNDSQSGGNFFRISDSFTGAPASELIASSSVSLAGPLLSATNSTITALFDLVLVQRSSLTSTTSSPLISLSGATVTLGGTNAINGSSVGGSVLDVFSANSSGAVALPASVSLAGPLLGMTGGASLSLPGGLGIVSIFNGGSVSSTSTSPFISISGSTVTQTNPTGFFNSLAVVGGLGGPSGTTPASLTLSGTLFNVSNSTLNLQGGLVSVGNTSGAFGSGRLIANDPTQPFVSLSGGTASIANVLNGTLFILRGTNTAIDTDSNFFGFPSVTVGTDQPLQRSGSGAFLSLTNGASLSTQQGFFLDTALLSATAPLLNLSGNSTLTTAADAINLNQRVKLTSLTQPLMRLDGSTLTINGNAVRVNNSTLVTGDLFSIANGGRLNINGANNAALFLSGTSAVSINGFLVNFTGVGNQLNIANTLCPTNCITTSSGINVALQGGATSSQVIGGLGTAINNPAGNTVPGASAALVIINGINSTIRLP
jgi:hypothetical protein